MTIMEENKYDKDEPHLVVRGVGNDSPLVSIIIPVYNTAPYLDEALESVVNQTLKDLEIICINDGSTDDSLAKLIEWADKDDRITVYEQKNCGLSVTRNRGMELAKGEYIYFMDSDDVLKHDAMDMAYRHIKSSNADVISFNAESFTDDNTKKEYVGTWRSHKYQGMQAGISFFVQMNKNEEYRSPVWMYMYESSFLKSNNIRFIKGILYEDRPFTMEVFFLAHKMVILDEILYFRRIREGSIVNSSVSFQKSFGCFVGYLRIRELVESHINNSYDDTVKSVCKKAGKFDLYESKRIFDEWFQSEKSIEEKSEYIYYYRRVLDSLCSLYDELDSISKDNNAISIKAELSRLYREKERLEYELRVTRDSFSCRLGLALTWMPRKVLILLGKRGKNGEHTRNDSFPRLGKRNKRTLDKSINELPLISIIIPVYNAQRYISKCINMLQNQTIGDFEAILIDDASTDDSKREIETQIVDDSRIHLVSLNDHIGAGASRNTGIDHARGKYIVFLDVDDAYSPTLLETASSALERTNADIVAYNFAYVDGKKYEESHIDIEMEYKMGFPLTFSHADYPDQIMTILNPVPWNKMYSLSFIQDKQLRFDELLSTNDISFSSVSMVKASKITYVPEVLYEYHVGQKGSISENKKTDNIFLAVSSAWKQVEQLSYFCDIRKSAICFYIDNLIYGFDHYINDWSAVSAKKYYQSIHEAFQSERFADDEDLSSLSDRNRQLFYAIKENNYDEFMMLSARKIVVSFTSHPSRMDAVPTMMKTILNQSHPADEIVMWLSRDDFPMGEKQINPKIVQMVRKGQLKLRWVNNNVRPHKKYIYAFREYKNCIVITIDDDMYYPKDMIDRLFISYLRYPNAVSTRRTHLMAFENNGSLLPYKLWPMETDVCIHKPAHQLLATGGAGTLYPPCIFDDDFLDESIVKDICINADDLWLKMMEIHNEIPVVLCAPYSPLHYIEGTQSNALCKKNVDENMNDLYMKQIIDWYNMKYGVGTFENRLIRLTSKDKPYGLEAVCIHYKTMMKRYTDLTQEESLR